MAQIMKQKRRQSRNTGSDESLKQAAKWVSDCVQKHEKCKHEENSQPMLPTRLIYVGISRDQAVRVLHTEKLPEKTPYITLSHCWGNVHEVPVFRLITETAADLAKGVPLSGLPKTFQDAVCISRALGVQYIWIDSLCIVQDSKEDWQKESLLMGSVYRHAYCNIAATRASNSQAGCFVERSTKVLQPVVIDAAPLSLSSKILQSNLTKRLLRYPKPDPEEVWTEGNVLDPGVHFCHPARFWELDVDDSVLLRRAWVFQERLLARRVLHFADSQIFFECLESCACELFPEGIPIMLPMGRPKMELEIVNIAANDEHSDSRDSALTAWQRMVSLYNTCELTYETDRFVAIAGIARRLQPILKSKYYAGLWEFRFVEQLTWASSFNGPRPKACQPPSWSWACRPGVIGFRASANDPPRHSEIILEDVDVRTVDGNEMSQVLSGCLRLTGRLIPITFRHRPGEMPIEGSSGNVGEIEVHGAVFTFWSDVANAELEGQLYSTTCISDLEWSNDAKVLGLVLKPTGKERGQYHRVGLFQTYTSGSYKREQPLLSRANPVGKALITKYLYKIYHKDIDKYTFTIV